MVLKNVMPNPILVLICMNLENVILYSFVISGWFFCVHSSGLLAETGIYIAQNFMRENILFT